MRYFEDLEVGETHTFGTYEVTAEEIVAFAEQYDPQPIHVDPEVAETVHGGLIASGWHTAAMTMRLMVDHFLADLAVIAAAGIEELTFAAPVRPGHELSVEVELLEKTPTKPGRGRISPAVETVTQDGETVLAYTAEVVMARRGD